MFHPIPGGALPSPSSPTTTPCDLDLYLRIAPELYLKRLVVGGIERVFEIGRVFRNEGLSTRHNPEFTMLELYQAYADYSDMMALVEEMVAGAGRDPLGTTSLTYGDRAAGPGPAVAAGRHGRADRRAHRCLGRRPHPRRRAAARRRLARRAGGRRVGAGKLLLEIYEKTTETEPVGSRFRHGLPGRGLPARPPAP